MHWTPVLSSFMLRRFHDLLLQGVKTDKGLKEVHVRQVAGMLSEFAGVSISVQQIYNHLRKWRQRWVKVVRLRDISGALWNEEHHMIVLDDEHLNGHTKVWHWVVTIHFHLILFLPFLTVLFLLVLLDLSRIILLMLSSSTLP